MKPAAYAIEYYDSGEICELVEQDCSFKKNLWYYWTQANYDITEGTITAVYFDRLLDELRHNQEQGLADNLKQLMKELNSEDNGVFVAYFW